MKKRKIVLISCLILIFIFGIRTELFSQTLIRKLPYLLYEGKSDEMVLVWQLRENKNCTVSLGTDQTYSLGSFQSSEYGNDHQHKYTFKNLNPATKYYYKVTAENETVENAFFSAPDTNAVNVKFLAYGDTRNNYMDHDALAQKILSSYSDGYQTMCLGIGDYTDAGGSEIGWDNEYFNSAMTNVRNLFGSLPIQGAQGDHENAGDGGKLYRKYLPFPFADSIGTYWSFDYGPVHFAYHDQFVSQITRREAYKWLENDLASSTKKWKIVLIHRPGWSTGSNGNEGTIQTIYQPLFEKYKVSMVIAGHNHLYARASVNGIKHITTGGGGAPLYDPSPADQRPNIETFAKTYNYCTINIEGEQLTFTAISIDGSIIDQFTINPLTSVDYEKEAAQPKQYKLYDAYPNPFNPVTTISFSLPERSKTRMEVYDPTGRLVATVIDADLEMGVYHYKWNASGLASGIYFCKLSTEKFTDSIKLNLIK